MRLDNYKYALVNDVLDQAATEMRAIVLHERGEGGTESAMAAQLQYRTHAFAPAECGAEEFWRDGRRAVENRSSDAAGCTKLQQTDMVGVGLKSSPEVGNDVD